MKLYKITHEIIQNYIKSTLNSQKISKNLKKPYKP